MRKPLWCFLISVLTLLLSTAPVFAQRQVDWDKVQIKSQKLADNIYMLQGTGVPAAIGNVGVLVTDDFVVLVDCEYAELGPKLEAAVKSISDKPVKYVFNTHWHGDHTGGNAYFGKYATIIAQDNARKMMETGGKLFPPSPAVALPTFTFSDELTLHTSAGDVHAIHFPHGHTNTDSVIFFPGSKVVQTGDNFVNWEVPGFPAIDQDADGSGGVEGEIAIAEYVMAHAPDDVKIIPGHGILASKADLGKELAVLKDTSAAVKVGISQGKSLDQLKQEKVLAKWDYLNESHHIQSDVYFERLYKDLSKQKSN
jgi:cyclase